MLRCPFAAANSHISKQGFPQVLRTWGGGSSKFDGGGLKSIHEGSMGGLRCSQKIPVTEFI